LRIASILSSSPVGGAGSSSPTDEREAARLEGELAVALGRGRGGRAVAHLDAVELEPLDRSRLLQPEYAPRLAERLALQLAGGAALVARALAQQREREALTELGFLGRAQEAQAQRLAAAFQLVERAALGAPAAREHLARPVAREQVAAQLVERVAALAPAEELLQVVRGHREAEVLRRADDAHHHAHHLAARIHERPAAIARVDRRVGLQHGRALQARMHAHRAQDPRRGRPREPERRAEGDHALADAQLARIGELEGLEVGRCHLQEREIAVPVVGLHRQAVVDLRADCHARRAHARDHVQAGHDHAVGGGDEAAARAGLLVLQHHDRGRDAADQGRVFLRRGRRGEEEQEEGEDSHLQGAFPRRQALASQGCCSRGRPGGR
jgi:hypothetical protein